MKLRFFTWWFIWFVGGLSFLDAQEYRVEVTEEAAPAEKLSDEVAALLSTQKVRVIENESRTVCEIWPCQEWPLKSGFSVGEGLMYPFEPGQLIGVVQLKRRGSDFRNQSISRGVYTLRYALQPIDGNHTGTSPTRDFLLMLAADQDRSAAPMEETPLNEASAAVAGSSHPAMLCLQRPVEGAEVNTLAHEVAPNTPMLAIQTILDRLQRTA